MEAIGLIEKKTEEKSGEGKKGPWTLMSITLGGRKYGWFVGQAEGEELLHSGARVKITYTDEERTFTDKKTGKVEPYTSHNITKVEPAPADAGPSVPTNGHGDRPEGRPAEKYTDDDKAAFRRRDEQFARQTACNCASTIVSAALAAGLPAPDFWVEAEHIAHYITTGEAPPMTPQIPEEPRKSPALVKADAQFDKPPVVEGHAPPLTGPQDFTKLAEAYGIPQDHLANGVNKAYGKTWRDLTINERMDVMRRCAIIGWCQAAEFTAERVKSTLAFTFTGNIDKSLSVWELDANQVSFLYDPYPAYGPSWQEWFAQGQARTDWAGK